MDEGRQASQWTARSSEEPLPGRAVLTLFMLPVRAGPETEGIFSRTKAALPQHPPLAFFQKGTTSHKLQQETYSPGSVGATTGVARTWVKLLGPRSLLHPPAPGITLPGAQPSSLGLGNHPQEHRQALWGHERQGDLLEDTQWIRDRAASGKWPLIFRVRLEWLQQGRGRLWLGRRQSWAGDREELPRQAAAWDKVEDGDTL